MPLTPAGPLYMHALKAGKLEKFFELLYPIWFDCFPVVLNDRFDDELGGCVDPIRQGWVESLQEKRNSYLRYTAFSLYLKGHQWDVIIMKEEREKELSGEGLLQFCLDSIVNDLSYEFLMRHVEEDEENLYRVEFLMA
ncbi:hypothetical protein DXG01_003149 [Tephrocybe rancida]|nr:hypothetical protein DXG01_003149 [Tephrocybe rancida]